MDANEFCTVGISRPFPTMTVKRDPICQIVKLRELICIISLIILRPGQNDHHFADIFKLFFVYESYCILIKLSLEIVPKGPIS